MFEPDLSLQKPLEDFIELFENSNPRAMDLLDAVSSVSLALEDPYLKVQGRESVKSLWKTRFSLHQGGRYKVHDFSWGRREATAYIKWSFLFKPKRKKKLFSKNAVEEERSFDAMSQLSFLPNGQIFSIVDFWGMHDGFNIQEYAVTEI